MDLRVKLEKQKDELLAEKHEYQQLVGSLMYTMIGYTLILRSLYNKLSQFNTDSSVKHFQAGKLVLQYLHGNTKLGITYGNWT